jgi:hypothetical protein
MEIDLERAKRAVVELGSALEEARQVIRPGVSGRIRVKTEGRMIDLPHSWALAGVVAFALATLLSGVPGVARRARDEEPLGIG